MLLNAWQIRRTRPVLAAIHCIKGSVLWKLTKAGAGEGHPRFFRLFPSESKVQWDSAEPLLLLGAVQGFSAAAKRTLRPAPELEARAFRFVFWGDEADVIARSVAERDLWLLAIESLPVGAAFGSKVLVKNKYDLYADASANPALQAPKRKVPTVAGFQAAGTAA